MTERMQITKDKLTAVVQSINSLVGKQVLVGFPEATASREDEEGAAVTNAQLGYIHEFGAPGANIPARPFLIPGVRKGEKAYMPHLRAAADTALQAGSQDKVDKALTAAGMIAASSAKHEIHTGDFAPLKPSTIRARKYARGTESRRESEDRYMELVRSGVAPAAAQEEAGIRPLINSGQLSNAITSVVRKK